jgi:hypothetical protein
MIQALIGPIAELAGGWLKGKADANAAAANLKLVEAEAKATIMKNAATSESDWERLMAQGSQNSWKDEWPLGRTSGLPFFSQSRLYFVFYLLIGQIVQCKTVLLHWNPCLTGINTRWE